MEPWGSYSNDPPPRVNPDDLKRVWLLQKTVRSSIQADIFAEHCSPGADVKAVWFRSSFLHLLVRQGLLAPWLDGDNPAEFLFEVFATYPVHLGDFDPKALLQHIREKSGQ